MKLETKFTTRSYAGKERTYVCSLTSPNKKDFVLQIGGQVVYLDVSGVMALHEMLSKACKPKLEVAPGPEPEEPEAESEEVPEPEPESEAESEEVPEPEPESEADPEAPEPEPEKNPNAKARRGKGK